MIAAGSVDLADHSLALAQDGTVWAWGRNDSGQLGVSTTATCDFGVACSPGPVMVTVLSSGAPVTALAVGTAHSLALRSDGTVWAWGDNSQGELGDSTFTSRSTPAPVVGLSRAVAIAAGSNFSVALKADGMVWAWGRNDDGMLGDGTTTTRPTPVQAVGLSGITHLVAGDAHMLAMHLIIDSTPPVITPIVSGTEGNNGWYTSDVSVSWDVSDPESPITETHGCEPVTISTDTAGITLTCTATSAGGTASKSIAIKRDATPPSVVCGAADGVWHASNVSIACAGGDAMSGLANAADASFNLDTSVASGTEDANAATNSRSLADLAGNSATAGPVMGNQIDQKAPQLASCDTPDGIWHTANVTLLCHYTDGGAGPSTQDISLNTAVAANTENADASASANGVQACDAVGNCAPIPTDIAGNQIDRRAPTIAASAQKADNTPYTAGTWTNQSVIVHFTCADGGSGVASCPADQTITAEGVTTAVIGTVADIAGNSASASFGPVQIDTLAPTIVAAVTSAPNGTNGWYTHNVVVHFTCSDGGSGIPLLACPADQILSAEGASVASTPQTVTDAAGNVSAPSNVVTVKIDKTAPSLSPSVSPNPVYLNGTATATAGAKDNLSGITTQSCGTLSTGSVGQKSVTCAATDLAGNTTSASAAYRVIYRFDGFLQPINDTAHSQICGSPCPVSIFKGGSSVPVKFQLKDANGVVVQSATLPTWLAPVQGGPTSASIDESVFTDTPSSGTTYSWDGEQYYYNWKTKGITTGFYWRIGVALDDGQTYYVYVGLR